jgi:hypothetical protein
VAERDRLTGARFRASATRTSKGEGQDDQQKTYHYGIISLKFEEA